MAEVKVGDKVMLMKLEKNPQLNSSLGIIKEWHEEVGRWVVKVLDDGEIIRVKPCNLLLDPLLTSKRTPALFQTRDQERLSKAFDLLEKASNEMTPHYTSMKHVPIPSNKPLHNSCAGFLKAMSIINTDRWVSLNERRKRHVVGPFEVPNLGLAVSAKDVPPPATPQEMIIHLTIGWIAIFKLRLEYAHTIARQCLSQLEVFSQSFAYKFGNLPPLDQLDQNAEVIVIQNDRPFTVFDIDLGEMKEAAVRIGVLTSVYVERDIDHRMSLMKTCRDACKEYTAMFFMIEAWLADRDGKSDDEVNDLFIAAVTKAEDSQILAEIMRMYTRWVNAKQNVAIGNKFNALVDEEGVEARISWIIPLL